MRKKLHFWKIKNQMKNKKSWKHQKFEGKTFKEFLLIRLKISCTIILSIIMKIKFILKFQFKIKAFEENFSPNSRHLKKISVQIKAFQKVSVESRGTFIKFRQSHVIYRWSSGIDFRFRFRLFAFGDPFFDISMK